MNETTNVANILCLDAASEVKSVNMLEEIRDKKLQLFYWQTTVYFVLLTKVESYVAGEFSASLLAV
jgi:hypothetical protein